MPKAKTIASLSGMIDSDMEGASDLDMMPIPDSNQENAKPTKVGKSKAKAAPKVRKTKPASQRLSGGRIRAPTKKKIQAKRVPLKEQTNVLQQSDTEDVDNFEAEEVQDTISEQGMERSADELDVPVKKPRGRKPKTATKAKAKEPTNPSIPEQVSILENDGEFEYTPTASRQTKESPQPTFAATKKGRATKNQKPSEPAERTVLETQAEDVDTDQSIEVEELEEAVPQSVYRQVNHARSNSKQPQPAVKRRAGSASDTERGGSDPALRRKLGELTKKFENLDLKYRNLREVGIQEASANFEKLKKSSEERNETANDLITSLRTELAALRPLATESRSLASKITTTNSSLSAAQATISKLTGSLSESQNENKALQARLAAARTTAATVESASSYGKTPSSALKGKGPASRTIMVGSAEAALAAQVAQLKEDLYSDLTGLILRGVDRREETDTYDCIQTGRNGTLHFHLAIANPSQPGATHRATAYEDIEFTYTPRLDANRDADLLDILPDYLTEEITFSRVNAAKFYSRVVDCLTKRMEE